MRFFLIIIFIASVCYADNELSITAASMLSYRLEVLTKHPERENFQEIDDLWAEAKELSDQNTLKLARFYFNEAQGNLEKQEALYAQSSELLDYLSESRALYPHFENNSLIDDAMRKRMKPHLLPQNHAIKPVLDALFSTRITENIEKFTAAGFQILFDQATSFVKVARHPLVPGYLFKLYLDDEVRQKGNKPGWHWLCNRCEGADRIRRLIKKKKIKNFTVPDKWLYPLNGHNPSSPAPQPVILIVTDMNITSREQTLHAWKTKITKKHLDEFHTILSHGMGSRFLSGNVPYTHNGKFAFIDTEYPKRKITLSKVTPYLSPEMQKYWNKLIKK